MAITEEAAWRAYRQRKVQALMGDIKAAVGGCISEWLQEEEFVGPDELEAKMDEVFGFWTAIALKEMI